VGQHGSPSESILLGLDGFEVTAAAVIDASGGLGSRPPPPRWAVRPAAPEPDSMLAVRCGCGTCRSVACRWCGPDVSGCGAVWSRRVRSGPGPSRRSRSGLGQC
jgi:hypothetical protein